VGCGQFGQGHSFCSNFTFVMFHHLYTGNTAHLHTHMSVPIAPSPAVPTASGVPHRPHRFRVSQSNVQISAEMLRRMEIQNRGTLPVHRSYWEGVPQGVWWAAATLTSVGYVQHDVQHNAVVCGNPSRWKCTSHLLC
jgi:hypothetical protein